MIGDFCSRLTHVHAPYLTPLHAAVTPGRRACGSVSSARCERGRLPRPLGRTTRECLGARAGVGVGVWPVRVLRLSCPLVFRCAAALRAAWRRLRRRFLFL